MLFDRFELDREIGRGGFGIVYLAFDRRWDDWVAVKELAPESVVRQGWARLELGEDGPQLRQRFIQEARSLGRIESKHLLPVRASWVENGTAYYATPYHADAEPLDRLIRREGSLPEATAFGILQQLLSALRSVHQAGLLHRDVKPSNVLVRQEGTAFLIDFGAAREWGARSHQTQTIHFTPAYAPPEQLSIRAPRGPASDLFSLSATAYAMLTGEPPESSTDRTAGVALTPIRSRNPSVSEDLARVVERGLALAIHQRPQSVDAYLAALGAPKPLRAVDTLEELDRKLVRASRFHFSKRGCPVCEGLLREAPPMRPDTCPCCSKGMIRTRRFNTKLCPVCRAAPLRQETNTGPLAICPECRYGHLRVKKVGLFGKKLGADCPLCEAHFEAEGEHWTRIRPEPVITQTARAWQQVSLRAESVMICTGCTAQFDMELDGRWRLRTESDSMSHSLLYPEEWVRVAHGLEPSVGNAECDACSADFYLDDETVTLLNADPGLGPFASEGLGLRLRRDDLPWLAAGKQIPEPGFVCDRCATEFSEAGEFLKLVYATKLVIDPYLGYTLPREDWHRIGAGLPLKGRERELEAKIPDAIHRAYVQGEIGFAGRASWAWHGPAERLSPKASAQLTWDDEAIVFGGLLRKERIPVGEIEQVEGSRDAVILKLSGGREVSFWIEKAVMEVELESGTYEIELTADDLVQRLANAKD